MPPDMTDIPIHDIHLPDPVSWWPLAFGWWLLMFLSVLALALTVWYFVNRNRYKLRRAALSELNAQLQAYHKHYDVKRSARDLSVLMRRICISFFPPTKVAGLTGKDWLAFLDSNLSAKQNKSGHKFQSSVGEILTNMPYRQKLAKTDIDMEALFTLCDEWIHSLSTPEVPFRSHDRTRTNKVRETASV